MAGAWPLTRWLATVLAAGMLLVTSTQAVAAEITIAPTTARIPADADQATRAKPGFPESVAMLVQIGDHLSKQYDLKG